MNTVSSESTRKFLAGIVSGFKEFNFAVRFWDGGILETLPGEAPRFTLVLKHHGALRNLLLPPTEMNLCEAYFRDEFDIEGDILSTFEAVYKISVLGWNLNTIFTNVLQVLNLPQAPKKKISGFAPADTDGSHTKEMDKEAVTFHYDVSNDFYRLWLDDLMVYSGAYFRTYSTTLNQAQIDKLDFICKKLRLQPGERMMDIGCGWGALIMHAAEKFKADVTGVTLSPNQAELANANIARRGLQAHCRAEVKDYRDTTFAGQFDKVSSVEMLHHVGVNRLDEYFKTIHSILKPGGVSFQLAITSRAGKKYHGPKFAPKYFMPDYELVPISDLLQRAEYAGLEVVDVEDLREHYQLTAEIWLQNIERHHSEIAASVGEVVYRVWRLSVALMAYGFRTRLIYMYHFMLQRPAADNKLPALTREDWYQ